MAAALAASLPDIDVIAGLVLHGDPWKMHRRGTHTLNFAITAGALAGAFGLLGAGTVDGERDLVADALIGAAIVGSHVPLDAAPIPKVRLGPRLAGASAANWVIDAALWCGVAWAAWPRETPARSS